MTMEPSTPYARRHLALADEFLEDAETLLARGRLRTSLDRGYYAMFYAARALLVQRGVRLPKTHRGLVALFGQEVVNKGGADPNFSYMLAEAFRLRQLGTYEIAVDLNASAVASIVAQAHSFVEQARAMLD